MAETGVASPSLGGSIDPAEVESALTALREVVSDAAVVVRRNEDGVPLSLVAYVVLREDIRKLLPRHLQAMLAQRLPRHMIPSQILVIRELPRLPNFELDRSALVRLDADYATTMRERLNDPLIDGIAEIFEAVIGVSGATPDDTIASFGGDSLQEINVIAELERCYDVAIPDDLIKQGPSIRSIARWLESRAP